MKYIISYDIGESKIRDEFSHFLISNNFIRIQKSIFLGEIIDTDLLEKIMNYHSFFSDEKNSLLIFPLSFENFSKSYFFGKTFDLDLFEQFKDFIIF